MNEIETVLILSKHDRIHKGTFSIWTNDSVVMNLLKRFKVEPIEDFTYILSLTDFIVLPKQNRKNDRKVVSYPTVKILSNDNLDKETVIMFTQEQRKKNILHIMSEDEYFIKRFMNFNVPYENGYFISKNIFKPFGRKTKLTTEEKSLRVQRMIEAKASQK